MLFKVLMLVGFLLSFLFIWGYFSALAKCDRLDVKKWCIWDVVPVAYTSYQLHRSYLQSGCTCSGWLYYSLCDQQRIFACLAIWPDQTHNWILSVFCVQQSIHPGERQGMSETNIDALRGIWSLFKYRRFTHCFRV